MPTGRQRTSNPVRPSGDCSSTSTESTLAALGPSRANSMSASTASGAPSKTASTVPSGTVCHPPGDTGLVRLATRALAEEDSLHIAAHGHVAADGGGAHGPGSTRRASRYAAEY